MDAKSVWYMNSSRSGRAGLAVRDAKALPSHRQAIMGDTQMVALSVNGTIHDVDVDPGTDLLWVLRDHVGLTGTKYGCGIKRCGACTVHVDGAPVRSCSIPLSEAAGKTITTIE